MSIFTWIKKLRQIPLLEDVIGAFISHIILEKEGKKQLNPELLRQEAPRFKKNLADEARFGQLIAKLNPGLRKDLTEKWLPDLGENQREDFILSIAEMTVGNTDREKATNENAALEMLTHLARLGDNTRRTRVAASMRFMKADENRYFLVCLEQFAGRRFQDLQEIKNWATANLPAATIRINANTAAIRANTETVRHQEFDWDPRVRHRNRIARRNQLFNNFLNQFRR